MNDESPDPIEAWRDVSAQAARSGGFRGALQPKGRTGGAAGWPLGLLALAVVALVAGLSFRQGGVAASPSPAGSPLRDALHLRADELLAAWAAASSGSPVPAFVGDLTGQTGDWEEAVGENNKRALMAGLLKAASPLSTEVPSDAEVRWPDDRSVAVPVRSAAQAFEDLTAAAAAAACDGCTALEVTGATLTTVPVETTRGPATAPAWRFTIAGTSVTVTRIAVADSSAPASPPPFLQALFPTVRRAESASGSAAERNLVVDFVGAPGPASQPCGADYTAEAVESPLAVVVIVTEHANPTSANCRLVGAGRTAAVVLGSPLGDRAVIDIAEGLPIPLNTPSSGPNQSAEPTKSTPPQAGSPEPSTGAPPVSGSAEDGMFRLELTTPPAVYGPNDLIAPVATVTYLGPNIETSMYHAASPVGFIIEEVGGDRQMDGGMDDPCLHTAIERDQPLAYAFEKAGTTQHGFGVAWYQDPVLRLPVGTWRIRAYLEVDVTDGTATCGGLNHHLEVESVITVR